jgi:hopene-associated glycosyltransferase HpnB
MLIIGVAVLSLLIWIYLLAARGSFWRVGRGTAPKASGQAFPGLVAVVVPARNEADVVGESVRSLLSQTGVSVRIFLVDDCSTDGTAQAARSAAAVVGKPEALTIVAGAPLPSGWSGKLWATQQGLEKAREVAPDFLLLTDADIVHAPDSIATLISVAETGPYDLVSFMVKLHCKTLAEKLLVPAFVFFFFMLYPPRWIADRRSKTAGAAGGCILIRPEWLERAGGIAAIRGEIIDDCALAARVKSAGGRLWLGVTPSTRSVRPYQSLGEIGRMISRAAFNQLHHSVWLLMISVFGLVLTYLAPPLLLFSHQRTAWICGVLACVGMIVAYLPMVRFYGLSPVWVLTLPLTAVFYLVATLHSAWRFWSGRGGEWKGRMQDPRRQRALE